MEIRFCGYLAASFLLEQDPEKWDVIVIVDSGASVTDFVQLHSSGHLILRFDDIERSTDGRRLATAEDLKAALDFAAGSERLLVTCRAGQSRSAALAYLIACRENGASAAMELIDPRRHIPNRFVVTTGTALLDMPDALAMFEKWQSDHRHITLSDYYDEIEREFDELVAQGAVNRIVAEASN